MNDEDRRYERIRQDAYEARIARSDYRGCDPLTCAVLKVNDELYQSKMLFAIAERGDDA